MDGDQRRKDDDLLPPRAFAPLSCTGDLDMSVFHIITWLSLSRPLTGYMSSRSPFYLASVILGILVFALVIGLRKWRGDKITWDVLGKSIRQNLIGLKKGEISSPEDRAKVNWAALNKIGNSCPHCGAVAGADAIICPRCGSPLPAIEEKALLAQSQTGVVPAQSGEARKCPSCGTMVAATVQACPDCNWCLHTPEASSAENRPHIGIIRRDIMVGGLLAFKKDEWVNIESESPDPERPECKYVVLSRALNRRFLLSDTDLSK
jgi:uncharacterized OB-fold protein